MKSIMFWAMMAMCGVVEASQVELKEEMSLPQLYDHCFDYQFAESMHDLIEAETHFNIIDESGYLFTNEVCVDARLAAQEEIIYQQRTAIKALATAFAKE